jgi:hypothetical protein
VTPGEDKGDTTADRSKRSPRDREVKDGRDDRDDLQLAE